MKKHREASKPGPEERSPGEDPRRSGVLWRVLTLLQLVIIPLALLTAIVKFFVADAILQVPEGLSPGFYAAKQIPDRYFISYAENFVNLVATYQYLTAEAQFNRALAMMTGPGQEAFRKEMIEQELPQIKGERRSVKFYTGREFISVARDDANDKVTVTLNGTLELRSGTARAAYVPTAFQVVATTSPEALALNQNGIIIERFTQLSR